MSGQDTKLTHRKAAWLDAQAFLNKMDEEIYRSVRYQTPFSVILSTLSFVNRGISQTVPQLVRQGLRGLDFATSFNESQYGVGLPYSNAAGLT